MKTINRLSLKILVFVTIISLVPTCVYAGAHNLRGLSLLRCLGQVGIFRLTRIDDALCANEVIVLVKEGITNENSGMLHMFEQFIDVNKRAEGIYAIPVPFGLPEYEYELAFRSMDAKDWLSSRKHFEQALIYRPAGWSSDFYDHYRSVLAQIAPDLVAQIMQEQRIMPSIAPEIKVGRKEQPDWDTQIPFNNGWQLNGLTVRNWTALAYGFPITVDLFFQNPLGQMERQSITTENMIANGCFELGAAWNLPGMVAGWDSGNDEHSSDFAQRNASTDYGTSSAMVILPGGSETTTVADTQFIRLPPGTKSLLWSVWIDALPEGNPHIFVLWFDGKSANPEVEIPFQGNASQPARYYAGVIQVPEDAIYMQVRLANWRATGEAVFDNFLLLPLMLFELP